MSSSPNSTAPAARPTSTSTGRKWTKCWSVDDIVVTGRPEAGPTPPPRILLPGDIRGVSVGMPGPCIGDDCPIYVVGSRKKPEIAVIGSQPQAPAALTLIAAPAYDPRENYCGAEGGRRFPIGTWNKACKNHDDCYGAQRPKNQCDALLGTEVLEQCLGGYMIGAFPLNIGSCALLGLIYGGAVYVAGQDAYDKAKQK